MLLNYIKIAMRNIFRQRGYALINIVGLAIGIACCALIMLYVSDELSWDKFNEKADRTYRVQVKGNVGGRVLDMAVNCPPLAGALLNEFVEVEAVTRFRSFGFPVARYQDKVFSEEGWYAADSSFFDVFTVEWIHGDPKNALNKPNTVVLNASMAKKYFGDENPVGKTINTDNRRDYLVTGVVADFPHNSHLHFDFLGSLLTYQDSQSQFWLSNNYYVYVTLRPGYSRDDLQSKLPLLVEKYVGPAIQQFTGNTLEQLEEHGDSYGFFLQPLTGIHLKSDVDYELEPGGNINYVYIFSLIAISILGIACINFMNLATARSAHRAREVGIRKTLGSLRLQLVGQFMAESIFMAFTALFFAVILMELFLPLFNDISGKSLEINYFNNFITLPLLILVGLIVGVVAGSYPAFYLARFNPVIVLKGKWLSNKKGVTLRAGLVVFQFAISVILIIGTFLVYSQLKYIQDKNLGFDKEQILVVQKTDDLGQKIYAFMQQLNQHSEILNASTSQTLFGKNFSNNAHMLPGKEGTYLLQDMRSDVNFAETYSLKMLDGRFFQKSSPSDTAAVVLNKAAIEMFEMENPVGKEIYEFGQTPELRRPLRIIGVMDDFHFQSLHQKIKPLVIKLYTERQFGRYVSVKFKSKNVSEIIDFIEKNWKIYAGEQAFEYIFFDEDFAKIYRAEEVTSKLLNTFSLLAIFIACLGLLGLASFTTEQKTKEIGIRKVLGASVANLIVLLSKQFTKWVFVANIFAWPIAYLFMKNWLEGFAYRIEINLLVFILAGVLSLLIAIMTVLFQAVKSALADPIHALRYE